MQTSKRMRKQLLRSVRGQLYRISRPYEPSGTAITNWMYTPVSSLHRDYNRMYAPVSSPQRANDAINCAKRNYHTLGNGVT